MILDYLGWGPNVITRVINRRGREKSQSHRETKEDNFEIIKAILLEQQNTQTMASKKISHQNHNGSFNLFAQQMIAY